MIYYKEIVNEEIVSLRTFSKRPKTLPNNYVEITEEEYAAEWQAILDSLPEPELVEPMPTYDELLEAYTVLTGGEVNE